MSGVPAFSKVAKENLSDLAYQQMRRALMRSELAPGEILRLRPLSRHLGISITPIREALIRMVSENALRLDSRGSAVVPMLAPDELKEIQKLRIALEGGAAECAAALITEQELHELSDIQDEIKRCHAEHDFGQALILNEEFHFGLVRASRQPITYQILETLWMRCGPILSHLYDEGDLPWETHPHDTALEGLRDRDGAKARAAMERDIVEGGRRLNEFVENYSD
ncbi:GntR family transcriptional regulator [Salinisphaera dokdonensis CL-ES53]|uniref:GntR family transcriptional regulator n=1 Tax=Salinisphaera dokdonensis CL-ES53 TaxID=1304272 RepID=A0ABV2B2X7_9GAMM